MVRTASATSGSKSAGPTSSTAIAPTATASFPRRPTVSTGWDGRDEVIAQLIGHANVDTTLNVYTLVLDGSMREAVNPAATGMGTGHTIDRRELSPGRHPRGSPAIRSGAPPRKNSHQRDESDSVTKPLSRQASVPPVMVRTLR